jgi:hypothetical protein
LQIVRRKKYRIDIADWETDALWGSGALGDHADMSDFETIHSGG